MNHPKNFFRVHAVQRMFARNISARKVMEALQTGEIIEDYSAEMPEPSHLILGFQGKQPIHIVTSENPGRNEITVITVYHPDSSKWDRHFKRRKS
jgi:hypothetical protein